jgi:hypothetical protein
MKNEWKRYFDIIESLYAQHATCALLFGMVYVDNELKYATIIDELDWQIVRVLKIGKLAHYTSKENSLLTTDTFLTRQYH